MEHFYFFYFFITFPIGIVSLSISAFLYWKTKDTLLRYYLYFYAPFTLVIMLNTIISYLRVNITRLEPNIFYSFAHVEVFTANYLLMFTAPVFVHYLFSVPHAKRKNLIWGIVLGMLYIGNQIMKSVINAEHIRRFGSLTEDIIVVAVIMYVIVIGILYYKKLGDVVRKPLALKFLILFALFLPASINDTFLSELSPLRFHPILYCAFSIIFTYHFITTHFTQTQVPTDAVAVPSKEMFEQYHLSPREQEVIELLLQGNSNQKIADTLFISLNTVKKHTRNIYSKCGVSSRYELITCFKNQASSTSIKPEEE